MVTTTIKIPRDLSNKFNKLLTIELSKADDIISKLLIDYAKSNHRFDGKTGRLESSIKVKGTLQTELSLYVDLKVADYGEHIIKGFKSWNSDDFITQALVNNEAKINKIINTAVESAVSKMNSGV